MKNTLRFMAILCAIFCVAILTACGTSQGTQAKPQAKTNLSRDADQDQAQADDQMQAATSEIATPADSSYKIIAGDILQITVWKEEGLDQEVLVLPGGLINFPLIGSLNVQGETPADVQATIKEKLSKLIPDAAVSVSVKAALGHTVSVIGQVTKPGEFVMGRHLTVMQALSQAGGLTPYASESSIIILHHDEDGKETSIHFPYDDVVEGDHLEKDIVLSPGDVVVVPTAGLL